jgi:indole-3-glycerol phosphate synthase
MTSTAPEGSLAESPPSVLQRILDETREELVQRKRSTPLEALQAQIAAVKEQRPGGEDCGEGSPSEGSLLAGGSRRGPAARIGSQRGRFHEALARPGIRVIAEFKRRSPSAGSLRAEARVEEIVGAYERGGASALSVLTEGPNFGGSLADLRAARAACELPVLRKDFIVDPYQLYEALAAGADAVLLIVAALPGEQLAALHHLAGSLGLDVLVEVHDAEELARAAGIGARLVGVNNRDLRDFTVDVERTSRLLGDMPADVTVVSESGIATPEQLHELERQGVAAVLVGEILMRSPSPERALALLLRDSPVGS